ncbi:YitT family protein [Paenibacillus thailandensis]|uniref:YitT family protein n=1 Tax=Paenibacillus thailandensis TaxID=393250 RepID=A0ABW5R3H5_9BACL
MRIKRPRTKKPNPRVVAATNVIQLIVGAFVMAVSFNLFLVPNAIASGGVSGISILVERAAGLEPAITQWAINIPLFAVGLWLLGRRFALKTAFGTVILPLFILLTSDWQSPTDNPLLAAIYGGIGVGLGLGLVFRGKGSTGGLDLAAQILHKYTGLKLGLAMACFDGCVIVATGILVSPEVALYALLALFITSKTIDIVQTGFAVSKVAFIISDYTEELTEAILHDLDRGLTRLDGHGGYTGDGRTVLMVVLGQTEVTKLKQLVQSVDPGAFVIISDTAEVLGQGFKLP